MLLSLSSGSSTKSARSLGTDGVSVSSPNAGMSEELLSPVFSVSVDGISGFAGTFGSVGSPITGTSSGTGMWSWNRRPCQRWAHSGPPPG